MKYRIYIDGILCTTEDYPDHFTEQQVLMRAKKWANDRMISARGVEVQKWPGT